AKQWGRRAVVEQGRVGLPVNSENTGGKGPFGGRAPLLPPRRPGLVVAGRLRPAALRQRRSDRAVGAGRAGEIGPVRLPPRPRRDLFLRRRRVDRVVQPAMPGRRHDRGFGGAVVDHPAPLKTERRVGLAPPGAVIAIAELVLAYELAVE